MDIDVVITWVDGEDQNLAQRRSLYAQAKELQRDDIGGATRYCSIGEIKWCLASINRFAPWVRRIFIVTDAQDPQVTTFLETHFPQGYIPVEIVDHRQIFAGFESFLPTFNSLSIETMLWRIPNLSNHFIEMNDDLMFGSPVSPSDFFTPEGHPVCYASRELLPFTRLTRYLKRHKDGSKRVTFKGNMINAALIGGNKWTYLEICHTPKPLLREGFEECLGEHPERIEHNIRHRFRDAAQFNAEELHYLHLQRQHRIGIRSAKGLLFYMQPKQQKNYIKRKMRNLREKKYKFCCFNGLNLAAPDDLRAIKDTIGELLSIHID